MNILSLDLLSKYENNSLFSMYFKFVPFLKFWKNFVGSLELEIFLNENFISQIYTIKENIPTTTKELKSLKSCIFIIRILDEMKSSSNIRISILEFTKGSTWFKIKTKRSKNFKHSIKLEKKTKKKGTKMPLIFPNNFIIMRFK